MTASRLPSATIERLVAEAIARDKPATQDAWCAVAAHISVLADDGPWTDEHIIEVAASMARGLFGPAFERADYGQRTAWVDMCERALRKAIV
ncbi:MAG: hypothetical protein RL291_693 [Pseudomonadota bacterium]